MIVLSNTGGSKQTFMGTLYVPDTILGAESAIEYNNNNELVL